MFLIPCRDSTTFMNECVIMCLGLTVSVSSEVRIATGSMLRSVEPGIYKISFLSC
jgi:hypothetical protein